MKFEIKFDRDVKAVLGGLKKSLQKRIVKKAMKEAIKPVKAAVKSQAGTVKDTGSLARSIGVKIKSYRHGIKVLGIVGPRSAAKYVKGTFKRGPRKGQPRVKWPAKYAALVEKGTRRSGSRPFLRPALTQTKSTYFNILRTEIGQEINRTLASY